MAYSTWPSTLPQAPYYRYEGQQVNGLLDTETFLATQRTRTYPEESASFTFVQLTAAQFQTFRAWWDTTLNQCAPFTAPWLEAISTLPYFCRFDPESPWSATVNGFGIDLTINIELVVGVPKNDGGNIDYWTPIGPPLISFTADAVIGIAPFEVSFFSSSSGGTPISYLWDFGDGTTSTQNNPTHIYADIGTYTVSLTATNTLGSDTITRENYITAIALTPPNIDFSGTPTSGNSPLSVCFTSSNSGGTAASYVWDFGDGTGSTVANPVHEYSEAVDPYWSSVVIAMPMNGENNSTNFIDLTGKIVTPYGNAVISTAQSKFGGASGYFDGTGDYLQIPYNVDLDPGIADFTHECWVYPTQFGDENGSFICGTYTWGTVDGGSDNSGWMLGLTTTGLLTIGYGIGGAYTNIISAPMSVLLNTWTHVAVSRAAGTIRLYINGIVVATAVSTHNIIMTKDYFYVASYRRSDAFSFAPGVSFFGYIDGLRITNGVARYTSDFEPQSTNYLPPYTVSLTATNLAGSDTETKYNYITAT